MSFNKYSIKRCVALVNLLIAITLLSVAFFHNPVYRTLSNIGSENRLWFVLWGVFTCLAVYMNISLLRKSIGVENKIVKIATIIGSLSILVTVTVMGEHTWQVVTHWLSGIIFGALSYMCVFILLERRKTNKGSSLYIVIVLVAAVIDVITIVFLGLTALCEVTILLMCELVLLAINFLDPSLAESRTNEEETDNKVLQAVE